MNKTIITQPQKPLSIAPIAFSRLNDRQLLDEKIRTSHKLNIEKQLPLKLSEPTSNELFAEISSLVHHSIQSLTSHSNCLNNHSRLKPRAPWFKQTLIFHH